MRARTPPLLVLALTGPLLLCGCGDAGTSADDNDPRPSADDGSDRADGRDGEDGARGQDGHDGNDGADGRSCSVTNNGDGTHTIACSDGTTTLIADGTDGAPGADAPTYPTCRWCTPSAAYSQRRCTPDQRAIQDCVDDGDGCGHWEVVEACPDTCSTYYAARDVLGNVSITDLQVVCGSPPQDPDTCFRSYECPDGTSCVEGVCVTGDCRSNVLCAAGEACDSLGRTCEPSDRWATFDATLDTGFDGLRHSFEAFGEYLHASCAGTPNATYWDNASSITCTITIGPRQWSESSLGPAYAGMPLPESYVTASSITDTGLYAANCSSQVNLGASRFSRTGYDCAIEITSFAGGEGGHISGTFSGTAQLTGPGDVPGGSTLTIVATFRIPL